MSQDATYDAQGAVASREAVNGFRPDSTWSRVHGWCMLGLAQAAARDERHRPMADRCLNQTKNIAVGHELIRGDYFFLEAYSGLRGLAETQLLWPERPVARRR